LQEGRENANIDPVWDFMSADSARDLVAKILAALASGEVERQCGSPRGWSRPK
jgi:hypothetical protein